MSPPDPAVFVGFGLFLLFAVVVLVGLCCRERSRLDGWWHSQTTARWSVNAWEQACRESTNKSRARRGKEAS